MAEDRSRAGNGDSEGSIWKGLRTMIFGDEGAETLRDQLEEVISAHDEGDARPIAGDLAQLLQRLVWP